MRIDISTMRAAGLTDTQILDVIEKADAARRAKAAEKKRAQRAALKAVPETCGTNGDTRDTGDIQDTVSPSSFPLSSPPTPPPIIPQTPTLSDALCAREADFRAAIAQVYAKHGHLPPETGKAVVWLKKVRDPAICCAVIDDLLGKRRKMLTLSYFDGAIADAHAPPPAGEARAPPNRKSSGNGWSEIYRKSHGLGEFADGRGS